MSLEAPTGERVRRVDLHERTALVGPLDLRPGPHRLVVTDADGGRLESVLDVMQRPPRPARDWLAPDVAPELRATLEAGWLAMQEQGRWRLEAYQQARARADYAPARELARGLARGSAPPPTP